MTITEHFKIDGDAKNVMFYVMNAGLASMLFGNLAFKIIGGFVVMFCGGVLASQHMAIWTKATEPAASERPFEIDPAPGHSDPVT